MKRFARPIFLVIALAASAAAWAQGTSAWRVDSSQLYYDAGGGGTFDAGSSPLVLKADGNWSMGGRRGTWSVAPITPADWKRWKIASYGPTRKIVVNGLGDGPIESGFIWVIFHATPPAVAASGTVYLKLGRTAGGTIGNGTAAATAAPMKNPPAMFSGRFYRMVSGSTMEKWDFNRDGTFEHTWVAAGMASSRTGERGHYRIAGNAITLATDRQTTAFAGAYSVGAGSRGGKRYRWSIQLLGNDGAQGMILNGASFKVRHW